MSLARILTIARRELSSYFYAPIAYVVGVLFLAVQGTSFAALVEVLADPTRSAGYMQLMQAHFGGTMLFWAMLFLLVSVTSMRLIAEEKRQGTWETLLTTPTSEAAVLLGKWLGAVAFYTLIWLPTLGHVLVFAIYSPEGTSIALAPIATTYLGIVLIGSGLLALGLAVSALTSNQIIAAVASFSVSMVVLFVGQLDELAGNWLAELERVSAVVDYADLRDQLGEMSRGVLELRAVATSIFLTTTGLALAYVFALIGRRTRALVGRASLAAALVCIAGILANVEVARHPLFWDVSPGGQNSLSDATRDTLAALEVETDAIMIRPTFEEFDPAFVEAERLLGRMRTRQPLLRVLELDPLKEPERLREVAAEAAIPAENLREGGAVIFEMAGRRRVVDLLEMASFAADDLGAGSLAEFRAEEAFAEALAELSIRERALLCSSSGRGELSREGGLRSLAARLERDGIALADIGDIASGVPGRCDGLLIAGPKRPLSASAALKVARYLEGGGRVLFAARAGGEPRESGLGAVFAEWGVHMRAAVVVDPSMEVELWRTWRTTNGHHEHAISSGFRGRRTTLWRAPRAMSYEPPEGRELSGAVLVSASPSGWAETDLSSLRGGEMSRGQDDIDLRSVALAVEEPSKGARLVVLGSAESFESSTLDMGLADNGAFAHATIGWLIGRERRVELGDKTPEHLRLVMTQAERRGVFVGAVIVLPLIFALVGGALWWWRRRD